MKYWMLYAGVLITLIFGGGFLIRLLRDGDFYIAEFIGGVIGVIILVSWFFTKESRKPGKPLFM